LNGGSDEGFIDLRVVKIGIRLPGGSLGGGRPGGTRRSLREWDEGLNGGSDEAFIDLRVVKVGIRLPGTKGFGDRGRLAMCNAGSCCAGAEGFGAERLVRAEGAMGLLASTSQ
jgi:hypothetical protein